MLLSSLDLMWFLCNNYFNTRFTSDNSVGNPAKKKVLQNSFGNVKLIAVLVKYKLIPLTSTNSFDIPETKLQNLILLDCPQNCLQK